MNKKSNHHSNSRLTFINTKQILVTIPFEHEITNLIQKAHNNFKLTNVKHFGINSTVENLRKFNLYWARMVDDVKKYVAACKDCIMEKWEKPITHPKIITVDGPLIRLQIDLWELPKEIREKYQ